MVSLPHMKALLILLLAASGLFAQEKALEIRFVAQALPESMAEVRLVGSEKSSDPFEIPVYNLSEPIEAPARNCILQSTSLDTAKVPIVLPGAGSSYIVILIVDPKEGLIPVVLPGDTPSFGRGSVYMRNITSRRIVGKVGSQKFSIAPGSGEIVKPAGADRGLYDVLIGAVEEKEIRPLSTTRWPENNTQRSYLIFYENPVTKWIEFRAIDEFLPAPKND